MKKELSNLYILRFLLSITVIVYHIPMISSNLKIPYYNDSPIFEKGTFSSILFFYIIWLLNISSSFT